MTLLQFGFLIYIFTFCCGLILGSFLNSWMWRTRENVRIVGGFSICVHCRRLLKWYEKFPLFSFLFLKGKCRTCHKKIPSSYFWVEFLSGCLLVSIVYYHLHFAVFSEWNILRDVLFLTILIIVFVFDFYYQEILPRVVYPGLIIGFAINYFALNYSLRSLLLGILVGGGVFWVQYMISGGRWIGGGDVRLGLMMGVWLGFPKVLVALFVAYILGAIFAVILLSLKKANRRTAVPFGTFLAIATFFATYYGDKVVNWYLRLWY